MPTSIVSTTLLDVPHHYCPGCSHGVVHRLLGDVVDALGLRQQTIGVTGGGCANFSYRYFDLDMVESPPGRAPAVATGIKRVHPDRVVFTYQGEGDLGAVGLSEIVHAGLRGEKLTVVVVNNGVLGLTGGQLSPSSLVGQSTTTTPYGRSGETQGLPLKISEWLAKLPGVAFVQRVAVHTPAHVKQAREALEEAFLFQQLGKGLGLVEVLAMCPTQWDKSPEDSRNWLADKMMAQFPVGIYKRSASK